MRYFVATPVLTPLQIRLARVAAGMGLRELAKAAGVAPSTITRFENGNGGMQTGTLERVQQTLENAGIVFISADSTGGPGIRLRS